MTKSVNHLDQLAILQIDFDIWSGQVKLDDPDIKLGVGGEIPPKQLVDLGRKNVIDKAHLKPFNRLKTSARRLCLRHGMPFMNGFAVPLDRIDEISAGLEEPLEVIHLGGVEYSPGDRSYGGCRRELVGELISEIRGSTQQTQRQAA